MCKKTLLLFAAFSSFLAAQIDTSLILSEVMFYPASGNNEFVEIYNTSPTNSINLANFKIKYYTSNPDLIVDAGYGTVLPPKSFAIIFENDYDIETGIYHALVPANALILKISDNSFGSSGMANTTSRPIWLLNAINDTIDYYFYSANNSTGISDEKIRMNHDSLSSNWANSLTLNGTPGFTNSVTPVDYDLSIISLSFYPQIILAGNDVSVSLKINNKGFFNASFYSVEIFDDTNLDSLPVLSERVFYQTYTNLSSGDSLAINTTLSAPSNGLHQIIAQVNYAEDENPGNNKVIKQFSVIIQTNFYNDVVVNEIMYAPVTGEPEWVELYNKTDSLINLKNWKISDAQTQVNISVSDKFLMPHSYIIISKDSSVKNFYSIPSEVITLNLPSLNNTGDAVVIRDSLGIIIDSIYYQPAWGGNTGGKSLERISINGLSNDANNWGTSVNVFKATPGKINSITTKDHDLAIKYFKPSNTFGIIGDTINFKLVVKNIGYFDSPAFNINFYHDLDLDSIPHTSELVNTYNSSSLIKNDSITIYFNDFDYETGLNNYIALIDVTVDDDSSNNISFAHLTGANINEIRNDVVINEIMYAPLTSQPEWIELFNRSSKSIDIKNYKIADASDTVKVITNSTILNPNDFFVIAKDSTIFNYFNIPSQVKIASFPSLNNTDDKVIILDSLNRVIDSLHYYSGWGGTNGKSLERIDVYQNSTEPSNWLTSKSIFNATPGNYNSVTQKDFDLELSGISTFPKFPLFGNDVSISANIKNIGKNPADFIITLFEDTDSDSIPDIFLEAITGLTLLPSDSNTYSFSYTIQNLQFDKAYFIKINFDADQDTTNNYLYKRISPGVPAQSIVINEIMFAPIGGEPEWIEIYNKSNQAINLKNWTITDVYTTPATASIKNDLTILPEKYLVLTRDSSIYNYHRFIISDIYKINLPTLNNDVDGVILKDNRGMIIDSVLYSNQWGGTSGYSLERKNISFDSNLPDNWAGSIDIEQSTPGRINSITSKEYDLAVSGISFNPKFPTSGEDVGITALIKNNGIQTAQNFIVSFFVDTDSDNVVDLLLDQVNASLLTSSDSVFVNSPNKIYNLQNKTLTAVRILFNDDADTLNNYLEKYIEPGFPQSIVKINEVMYNPNDNNPEWIEFINDSEDTINIKNWSVSDILSTPTKNFITINDGYIYPQEYFIVTKDTSFNSAYPQTTGKIFYSNFGSLGNTTDGVIIYDFRNAIIDSFTYHSRWGNKKGHSIERISLTSLTNDSTNWISSLDLTGSTPNKINSIFSVPVYKRNNVVINEIMYDPSINFGEYVEFFNISNDTINIGGWAINDENGNKYKLSETSFILPPSQFFIISADSLIINYFGLQQFNNITVYNSSSLGLVNTSELILLKDARGIVIDSVFYSSKWNNKHIATTKGKSLERINPSLNPNDPSNWSTCVNNLGGTPGISNSIFAESLEQSSSISINPNPFSPDNDGFEDFALITYNLNDATAQVRIKIFDSKGRLVRNLLNNQPSGSNATVIFDGLDDEGNVLRAGIYIVFLEALNDQSGVVQTLKTVVVVAKKL